VCARGVKASRDREPPAAVCARGVLSRDRGVYCRCPHACGMCGATGGPLLVRCPTGVYGTTVFLVHNRHNLFGDGVWGALAMQGLL